MNNVLPLKHRHGSAIDESVKPSFSGIPFSVLPVSDMTRAKAFYGDVLGLKEGSSWENQWVEYDVGSSTLSLSTMMTGAQPGAKGAAVALETDQFDEAVALLKAHGVKFVVEPFDSGVCRFARLEDPDGNPLILHRRHPEARP